MLQKSKRSPWGKGGTEGLRKTEGEELKCNGKKKNLFEKNEEKERKDRTIERKNIDLAMLYHAQWGAVTGPLPPLEFYPLPPLDFYPPPLKL